jgi:hypothetical protein
MISDRLSTSDLEAELMAQTRDDFVQLSDTYYRDAVAALAHGRDLQASGKLEDAISAFRAGIEALGDRYESSEIIDDTGAKEMLALHNVEIGKLAEAAALLEGVLAARTQAYEDRRRREP